MFCSMANPSSKMMEVSRVGVEEEDEIELSLGLSIGGSFRKPAKSKLIDENHFNFNKEINSVSTNVSQKHHCFSTSSEQDSGSEYANPQAKHENIQRRNKRGEKLRNGLHGGTNGGYPVTNEFSDDKLWSEAKWSQNPDRERKGRENEALVAERACKRGKKEECVEMNDLNLTLSRNGSFDQTHISNPPMLSSSPSVPAQYSYPPSSNGFVYPYAIPNWSTLPLCNVAGEKNDNDAFPPSTFPNFRPDQGNQNSGHNLSISRDSSCFDYEVNSSKDGRNGNMVSNWSPLRNLSVVSDHPSKSLQGESSSDTKNHLSDSQSEHSASCNGIKTTKSELSQPDGSDPVNKFNIPAWENPTPAPLKGGSWDEGKPQACNSGIPSLLHPPCVSTTGNGPNGKTIIGLLCRYTKTDVSIICFCHGSSFSPAEFVEHAGGKDILHPLKHITMISSAFGL